MELTLSLERFVNDNNEDIAFVLSGDKEISYSSFNMNINQLIESLKENGVASNSHVLVNLQNAYDYMVVFIALLRLRCVIMPCGDTSATDVLSDVGIDYIITDNVGGYINQVSCSATVVIGDFSLISVPTFHKTSQQMIDVTTVFFTSGTTNNRKAVMFSSEAMYSNSKCLIDKLKFGKKDVLYTPISPLMTASLNTIFLPALLSGAKIVVCDAITPGKIMQTVNDNDVTVLFLIPYMYSNFLRSPAFEIIHWEKIKCCITSSSYMSPYIIESYHYKFGVLFCTIYCSSECGVITINNAKTLHDVKNTVGNPAENVDVLILVNENGTTRVAANNELGEILVKGSNLSNGYCNLSNDNLRCEIDGCTYYRTGDCGYIQQNGLVLVGRIDDVINIAGHLVSPQEIETVLIEHKDITDCLVYARLDKNKNQVLFADIVRAENSSIEKIDIKQYCAKLLQNYKVPTQIQFVDKILYTDNGKKIRKHIQNE